MSSDDRSLLPLYIRLIGSTVRIFLPREYTINDINRWRDEVTAYLEGRGYQTNQHYIQDSSRSKGPCKELWIAFEPLNKNALDIEELHLVEALKPKFKTAVIARYVHGHGFDDVRVGSHIQISPADNAPSKLRQTDRTRDWLRKRSIQCHVGAASSSCFNFILPAEFDPEEWQFVLANLFDAFLLKDDTDWSS